MFIFTNPNNKFGKNLCCKFRQKEKNMSEKHFTIKASSGLVLGEKNIPGAFSVLSLLLRQLQKNKTSPENYETQILINNTNASIDTIKNEQKQREKELKAIAEKINKTENKQEYNLLIKELTKKKEELAKEKKAVTKISHAVKSGNYKAAEEELGVFEENGTIVSNTEHSNTAINTNQIYPAPAKIDLTPLRYLGSGVEGIHRYTPRQPVSVSNYTPRNIQNINLPVFNIKESAIKNAVAKNTLQTAPAINQSEEEKHRRAEIYRQLCITSNDLFKEKTDFKGYKTDNGYTAADYLYDKKSNFKVVTFFKDDEIVICFLGTDFRNINDHKANVQMGLKQTSAQMWLAREYTALVKSKFQSKYKIILAGHSEGGSEAEYSGLYFGLETFTFNAFALSDKTLKEIESETGKLDHSKITNYRDPHDPISKLFNKEIGKTYIVENQQTAFKAKSPFGLKEAHALKMMGNCQTAVHITEYKKDNPWFIDKISLVKITNKDINDIYKAGLYDIYDEEIAERLKNNEIIFENEAQTLVKEGVLKYVGGHYEYLTE